MNQTLIKNDPLVRGFDDVFPIPQSRHATFRKEDIRTNKNLVVLAQSTEAGITLVKSKDNREIFMTGHLEYDGGATTRKNTTKVISQPRTTRRPSVRTYCAYEHLGGMKKTFS